MPSLVPSLAVSSMPGVSVGPRTPTAQPGQQVQQPACTTLDNVGRAAATGAAACQLQAQAMSTMAATNQFFAANAQRTAQLQQLEVADEPPARAVPSKKRVVA